MAYCLHIERPDRPIEISEWEAVVAATEGIRFATASKHVFRNPKTGEEMAIKASRGDVEIFDSEDQQWHAAVLWWGNGGSASFNSRAVSRAIQMRDLDDPIWTLCSSIARALGALICGDEGEVYDLDTAQPDQ